jgi:prophage regulatory protein
MANKWLGSFPGSRPARRRTWATSEHADAAGQLCFRLDPLPEPPAPVPSHRSATRKTATAGRTNPDAARRLPERTVNPTSVDQPPATHPQRSDVILRLPAVKAKTGLSRSTIYAKIDQQLFPAQIPLGPTAVGWSEEEVDVWVEERKRQRANSS